MKNTANNVIISKLDSYSRFLGRPASSDVLQSCLDCLFISNVDPPSFPSGSGNRVTRWSTKGNSSIYLVLCTKITAIAIHRRDLLILFEDSRTGKPSRVMRARTFLSLDQIPHECFLCVGNINEPHPSLYPSMTFKR